jgi:hypothetical protein
MFAINDSKLLQSADGTATYTVTSRLIPFTEGDSLRWDVMDKNGRVTSCTDRDLEKLLGFVPERKD